MKKILTLLAAATMGGIMACLVCGDVVFAYDSDPDSLTLSVSDNTLYISTLIPGDFASSNGVDITIDTSNETGYQLSASVGSSTYNTRDLVHSTNPQAKFSSLAITESTAITRAATWGYSTTYGLTYSGLPLYNDEENVLILSSADEPSYNTVNFRIGAKAASDQATGEYSNIINFIAVTNPIPEPTYPYMQDMTWEMLQEMPVGDLIQLRDNRTGVVYDVHVMNAVGDDKILWMASDLSVPGGTTLHPYDSNVSADFTLSDEEWGGYYCEQRVGEYEGRYFYNYYAATANPDVCSDPTSGSAATAESRSKSLGDICPKGWRFPYRAETIGWMWGQSDIAQTLVISGDYVGYHRPTGAVHWASYFNSSTDSQYGNMYDYNNGALSYGSAPLYVGYAVRCMFYPTEPESELELEFDDTMQGMTPEIFEQLEVGETLNLVDARGYNAEYEISVLSYNGRKMLWMNQDLILPPGETLTPNDSNVSSNFTLNNEPWTSYAENYYCKQNMVVVDSTYYYNWYSATANPYAYNGDPADTNCATSEADSYSLGDICPKGWRLPGSNEIEDWRWAEAVQPTLVLNGIFFNGEQHYYNQYGYWTSSKGDGTEHVRALGWVESNYYTMYLSKRDGMVVRCMYVGD